MLHFIKDIKPTISKFYDRYDYVIANCIATIVVSLAACAAFVIVIGILVVLGRVISWLYGLHI